MRRSLTVLVATALIASPAAVAAASETSTGPGVLYSGCRDKSYSYSVDLPDDANYFNMDVVVLGADGIEVAGDYVYADIPGGTVSGTGSFQVCNDARPGRWTIEAKGTYDYGDYSSADFTVPNSAFTMRKPRSKTTITGATSRGRTLTIRSAVKDERPNGYFSTDYATTVVQVLRGRTWTRVKGTKEFAGTSGRTTTKVACGRGSSRIRVATVVDDDGYASSVSKARKVC